MDALPKPLFRRGLSPGGSMARYYSADQPEWRNSPAASSLAPAAERRTLENMVAGLEQRVRAMIVSGDHAAIG